MWHKYSLKYLLLESGLEGVDTTGTHGANLGGLIANQLLSGVVNVQVLDFIGKSGTKMFGSQPDMKIRIAPTANPSSQNNGTYTLKGGTEALTEIGIGLSKGIRIGRVFVKETDDQWFLNDKGMGALVEYPTIPDWRPQRSKYDLEENERDEYDNLVEQKQTQERELENLERRSEEMGVEASDAGWIQGGFTAPSPSFQTIRRRITRLENSINRILSAGGDKVYSISNEDIYRACKQVSPTGYLFDFSEAGKYFDPAKLQKVHVDVVDSLFNSKGGYNIMDPEQQEAFRSHIESFVSFRSLIQNNGITIRIQNDKCTGISPEQYGVQGIMTTRDIPCPPMLEFVPNRNSPEYAQAMKSLGLVTNFEKALKDSYDLTITDTDLLGPLNDKLWLSPQYLRMYRWDSREYTWYDSNEQRSFISGSQWASIYEAGKDQYFCMVQKSDGTGYWCRKSTAPVTHFLIEDKGQELPRGATPVQDSNLYSIPIPTLEDIVTQDARLTMGGVTDREGIETIPLVKNWESWNWHLCPGIKIDPAALSTILKNTEEETTS